MMFRRLRSSSRPVLCFRAAMFIIGLLYVLATTDTVKTFVMGFDILKTLGRTIEPIYLPSTQTEQPGTNK